MNGLRIIGKQFLMQCFHKRLTFMLEIFQHLKIFEQLNTEPKQSHKSNMQIKRPMFLYYGIITTDIKVFIAAICITTWCNFFFAFLDTLALKSSSVTVSLLCVSGLYYKLSVSLCPMWPSKYQTTPRVLLVHIHFLSWSNDIWSCQQNILSLVSLKNELNSLQMHNFSFIKCCSWVAV